MAEWNYNNISSNTSVHRKVSPGDSGDTLIYITKSS